METIPSAEERGENNESGVDSFLELAGKRFNRVMQIVAFASLMVAGESAVQAKEAPLRHKPEAGERTKDLAKVNAICQEHGFGFVDATEGHMEVHLPPGQVRKVILFLGQSHAQGAYSKVDVGFRKVVVDSQNDILTMFKNAYAKTHALVPCLTEGVCTEDQASTMEGKDLDHTGIENFARVAASDPHVDIKKAVEQSISSAKKYVEGSHVYDKESLKNSILFDASRSVRRALQEKDTPSYVASNLEQIARGIESHMQSDELAYTQGGAGIAARLGFAHIRPAENFDANFHVRQMIESNLGFKLKDGEDLYTAINHKGKSAQEAASKVIAQYAESKERETPAMANAEKELVSTDFVVLDYGAHHTFEGVLKDQYKAGKMQDVAMIKVDTRNFHFEKKVGK